MLEVAVFFGVLFALVTVLRFIIEFFQNKDRRKDEKRVFSKIKIGARKIGSSKMHTLGSARGTS